MHFEIVGEITGTTTIAAGMSVRQRLRLQRMYGKGQWRKRKGFAPVRIGGIVREAELHWYEANGIGRREFKIKRWVDRLERQ
jgi:hypothetical protein